MTVPSRVDAASLLLSLDPPTWLLRHSRAVAEIAGWLAARAAAAGCVADRRIVEAAALLHDVDKSLPDSDPARALPHGGGSAEWLGRRGHPELAAAVAAHAVTRLRDGSWFGCWWSAASLEERIVAYADKRAGQRLESMDTRFASWDRRYPSRAADELEARRLARERADRLERAVCAAAGIRPADVRRLGWTGPALRAARALGRAPGAGR